MNIRKIALNAVHYTLPFSMRYNYTIQLLIHTFQTITAIPKIRKTRSLNWIKSGWKYIAGSPDHEDLVVKVVPLVVCTVRLLKKKLLTYAIQWARLNIANTLVLNEDEKIFKRNNIPPQSIS